MLVYSPAIQAGLSTQIGEAVVENLQIGQSYSLKDLANLNLIVTNTADHEVDLRMDVLLPDPVELRGGAEPIPDVSWLSMTPDFFTLAPGGKAEAEIHLAIPDEERYLGRKFQVTIWSHTLPSGAGMFLAYGLKTRIIFTISADRPTDNVMAGASGASVDFGLLPEEIHLEGITPGQVFDVAAEGGKVLKVTNRGEQAQKLKLKSRRVYGSLATLTEGYEDAPDASFLRFSADEFVLRPGESRSVSLFLEFPDSRKYVGHSYMFVIHGTAEGERVTTGVYSRLYATVN
jgi:hypothetical protein